MSKTDKPFSPVNAEPMPKKPSRRMSSALQTMAKIERLMNDTSKADWEAIVGWFTTTYNRPLTSLAGMQARPLSKEELGGDSKNMP